MKPIFQLIAKDHTKDRDGSWSAMVVLHFLGQLEMAADMPETVSDEQISQVFKFCESYGVYFRSAGSGEAGQAFANEPFIQWFPNHIIITQSGGLDV